MLCRCILTVPSVTSRPRDLFVTRTCADQQRDLSLARRQGFHLDILLSAIGYARQRGTAGCFTAGLARGYGRPDSGNAARSSDTWNSASGICDYNEFHKSVVKLNPNFSTLSQSR